MWDSCSGLLLRFVCCLLDRLVSHFQENLSLLLCYQTHSQYIGILVYIHTRYTCKEHTRFDTLFLFCGICQFCLGCSKVTKGVV